MNTPEAQTTIVTQLAGVSLFSELSDMDIGRLSQSIHRPSYHL
jgi:hypothetical protein